MNEYTASNGVAIEYRDGGLISKWPNTHDHLKISVGDTEALREFFRAEEDERLGRWRWPENRNLVIYHARNVNGDHKVLNEVDGHGLLWGRNMEPSPQSSDVIESAARAYFDAHPEPKPWHEAQVGEVWVLDIDHHHAQKEVAWQVATNGQFSRLGLALSKKDDRITAGRRIWPES